jgi:hypothetical protein
MKLILLLTDGETDPTSIRQLVEALREQARVEVDGWPDSSDALWQKLDVCAADGVQMVVLMPLVLMPAAERLKALSEMVDTWRSKAKGTTKDLVSSRMTATVARPLGFDSRLLEMVEARIDAAVNEAVGGDPVVLTVDDRELTFSRLRELPGQIEDVGAVAEGREGEGVWFRSIMEAVGPAPGADRVTCFCEVDGFTASVDLETVVADGFVIYASEGRPLQSRSGGPARLMIPGYDDRCANVKGVSRIEITGAQDD